MSVEYEYCGSCKECLHEDEFTICGNDECGEDFEHPTTHGRYCIDCGVKNKIFIKAKTVNPEDENSDLDSENDNINDYDYFCNKKCYNIWKKGHDQYLIDREKKLAKCNYCEAEKPTYKMINNNWPHDKKSYFCNRDCSIKYTMNHNKKRTYKIIKLPQKISNVRMPRP